MTLSQLLLNWYDQNARELPWRGTRDPYRIWLSEIMLQQTRAETVIRYYDRFLARFPAVADLAAADEDEVLKLWEGLGYYSRARNLHAAAKKVADEMNGIFPPNAEGLRRLPGIGPYAANAIASIAYGECVPALDGNQARVLSRQLTHEAPLKTPFDLLAPAQALMSADRPGDYNQALMDLGASICIPKRPKCEICPIASLCRAYADGDPEAFPKKQPRAVKREEDLTIVLVHSEKGIAVRRRPNRGLLAGLYEFPAVEGHPDADGVAEQLRQEGFGGVRFIQTLPCANHVFTHLIWHMKGARAKADRLPEGWIWCDDLDEIALPSAFAVYRSEAQQILRHP